jgi:undecaprenyl-diphosphatase
MLNSIILGIIQGLTEFLPVSSTAHLVIFTKLLKGLPDLDQQIFFDIMLHLGTLLAVVVVFRKRLAAIIVTRDIRTVRNIIIAMVPTGIIAVLFKDRLEFLFGSVAITSGMLFVTGAILLSTRLRKEQTKSIGTFEAVLIGTVQGISAVVRGISRSGSTISTGLLLGIKREEAGEFSFLLSIPAISCAVLLHGKKLMEAGGFASIPWGQVIAGTVVDRKSVV